MEVFIFMYVAIFIIWLICKHIVNIKNRRICSALLCFLLIWLIQGLRHETVGVDSYNSYRPFFDNLTVSSQNLLNIRESGSGFENGFILFSKFIKYFFSNDVQLYILLCSFVSLFPIAYLIYKHSPNIELSFIVYTSFILYHFGFSGIRQTIAIGITVLSFNFIVKKKPLLFTALVILASQFHTSAILFILAYPLYHRVRIDGKKVWLYLLPIMPIVYLLKDVTGSVIFFLFGPDRYTSALEYNAVVSYNLFLFYILLLIFTFISKNHYIIPYRSFIYSSILFQSLGLISSFATRIGYYYLVFLCLAIPFTLEGINSKNRSLFTLSIISFMVAFFFYCNAGGYLNVIPYKFFWQ